MHCASLSDAIGYLDMFKCNIAFNFPDACSCTKDDREVVGGGVKAVEDRGTGPRAWRGYMVWERVPTAVRPLWIGGSRDARWLKKKKGKKKVGGGGAVLLFYCMISELSESLHPRIILHHTTIDYIQMCS